MGALERLHFRERPPINGSGPRSRFPRNITAIGLDCDGTCTDGEREGVHYTRFFKEKLSTRLGSPGDFEERWARYQAMVEVDLSNYGWVINGKLVVPAHTDAMMLCKVIANFLLTDSGMEESQRDKEMYAIFKQAYDQTIPLTLFRPGLNELLYSLRLSTELLFVLTNSQPDAVGRKFQIFDAMNSTDHSRAIPIHGNAKKFDVETPWDPSWPQIPELVTIPTSKKDIELYVRRAVQYAKLKAITSGFPSENVAFVGDSLHLDGAVVLQTGMAFIFMPNPRTPKEEVAYVLNHPNGYVLEGFELKEAA
ncbi:HAD family hydrolase [Candidatus Micrarchaeota archaeon]|nr:HAD family hydrolase [Candidatus Micrarchaeota archaeon]